MSKNFNIHKYGENKNSKLNPMKKVKENQSKDEKMRHQIKLWTTFYRLNVHRFIEHYLGVELFFFQKILMYFMNINSYFMLVASRGLSKSWLIALFCIARCILYPNTKVVVASGVKKQARLIITEKIMKDFMINYPNIDREIKDIKSSANETVVYFHNGSTIEAVTSNDNSRGYRGNVLILEEFRMIDKEVLDTVLIPFLNVNRQPPFLKKKEYEHLSEENVELYISSAYFESHWMWNAMQSTRDNMLNGIDNIIFSMDYLLPLHHGLLSRKRIDNIKSKKDFDSVGFSMEYENLMFGQNEKALFALEDVNKNRSLSKIFYPIDNINYADVKNKRKEKLLDGELRILGVDVALMGGKNNDNTIITCMRLIPNGDSYIRKVVYIESIHGKHTDDQAVRIRQIFEDFQAHYVALDCGGNGLSLYDALAKITYDEDRDIEYEAWCTCNDEEMKSRAKSKNPLPVVFSIKGNRNLNHEIASSLRNNLQSGNIELPINELDANEMLREKKFFSSETSEEKKAMYLMPYVQTTALVNELVNLEHEIIGGKIVVKEASGKRKDRYSSLAYANYLAKTLEQEYLNQDGFFVDDEDSLIYF